MRQNNENCGTMKIEGNKKNSGTTTICGTIIIFISLK